MNPVTETKDVLRDLEQAALWNRLATLKVGRRYWGDDVWEYHVLEVRDKTGAFSKVPRVEYWAGWANSPKAKIMRAEAEQLLARREEMMR